jgi:hypothetical protein
MRAIFAFCAVLLVVGFCRISFASSRTSVEVGHENAEPPFDCSAADHTCDASWEGSRAMQGKSQPIVLI